MTAMRAAVIVLAMLSLAACTAREGERTLTKFSKSREPEEFSILPRKPLSLPPSMRDLPAPDTSTGNRSDQTPLSDAVSALGGRATADGARPTSDSALIAAARRFGSDPTIRTRLAAEDEVFRGSTRFTWQITRTNRYLRVYESQRLNPYAALDAFRKAGVSTPTAPPR